MEIDKKEPIMTRPLIGDYQDVVAFVQDMIEFRKTTEKGFSVSKTTDGLRRISPALVSLILKRKRKITLDRVDELAKLLNLNSQEKYFFRHWLQRQELGHDFAPLKETPKKPRKDVTTHILRDWINVYIKDSFQIPSIQKNPQLIYQCLGNYASPIRIDKAIEFLLSEGHLRRTLDGRIVVEANWNVPESKISSKKIRQFHKNALVIAKSALDLFPPSERFANTMIIPLNEQSYRELLEMIQEFSHKLHEFASTHTEEGERLYQFVLNLSPTGGKLE